MVQPGDACMQVRTAAASRSGAAGMFIAISRRMCLPLNAARAHGCYHCCPGRCAKQWSQRCRSRASRLSPPTVRASFCSTCITCACACAPPLTQGYGETRWTEPQSTSQRQQVASWPSKQSLLDATCQLGRGASPVAQLQARSICTAPHPVLSTPCTFQALVVPNVSGKLCKA